MKAQKQTLSILICFLVTQLALAQYQVNFAEAPLNPIPEKYTKAHWGYKGDIKTTKKKGMFGEDTQQFNTKGYITVDNNGITGKKDFSYNPNGSLKQMKVVYKGGTSFVADFYYTNNKLSSRVYNDGSGSKFIYDGKGLWVEKRDYKTNTLKEKYSYDNKGRIIKRETYKKGGNGLSSTETYAYQTEGNRLKVDKTTWYSSDNKTLNSVTYFDNKGTQLYLNKDAVVNYDSKGNHYETITKSGKAVGSKSLFYYDGMETNKGATKKSKPGSVQKPGKPNNKKIVSSCVSGDCVNGWGKKTYEGGSYTGFWSNGKKQGYGIYIWTGNGKYIGGWDNDTMSGYGVYFSEDNKTQVSGMYSNGKLNGYGKELKDGKFSRGLYSNGTLTQAYGFYNNPGVTVGCVDGDCQNKYGKYVWENGDSFVGFFQNGNLKMGTYIFANGDKYEGSFNNQSQFHGMGRFFFKNGEYYGGNWNNGLYDGKGYFQAISYTDDKVGTWSNGTFVKAL